MMAVLDRREAACRQNLPCQCCMFAASEGQVPSLAVRQQAADNADRSRYVEV